MSTTPPPPPPPSSPPPPPDGFGGSSDEGGEPGAALPGTPGGATLPSAWKRIGARFLDGMIVNLLLSFVILRVIAGDDANTVETSGDFDTGSLLVATLLLLAVSFCWDAVATRFMGGTPMKRAFRMRVVQAGGGAVEWKHAIIRWGTLAIWSIVPILSFFAPMIIVVVSLVFLFTKPLRQAVWDLTAKTVVVDG